MQQPQKDSSFDKLLSTSGATSLSSPDFATFLDQQDQLSHFRQQFSFPSRKTVWTEGYRNQRGQREDGGGQDGEKPAVYLAGNSLGLMPKATPELIRQELSEWAAK